MNRMDYLACPKHRKMDLRFGTWNVRSLYRSGSLKTVAGESGKYKLDLVGVQEVRWDKGGTERAENYTFFHGAGNEDHQLGTGFLYIRESYQQLGGQNLLLIRCHI
jgi:exonuclease III